MTRTVWPRTFAVLALLLFLTPAVFAAPRDAAKHLRPEPGVLSWLTQTLGRLLPAGLKSSGTMDPDGKPSLVIPATATSDASGTMDPDGRQ